MTIVCPCCRRPMPTAAELIADKVEDLREHCAAQGIEITWDGYVSDASAHGLLRISRGTLRNRRYGDRPIRFRKCAGHDEYSLDAIAVELLEIDID